MPVVCLNTSAYSTSEQPDMTTSSSYNTSAFADPTPTTRGISDPGDPLVYILAVLSFYVLSITLLMAKSIHGGREEKNYDDYLQNFIKRDGGRNNGYTPSAFSAKHAKSKAPPPKSAQTPPVEFTTPATGQPVRTALKKPHDGTRPKTKETVRLIEPSEIERIKALSKKDKKKKHSHRNLEPVLMTSV